MNMWLQSVTVWTDKPLTDTSIKISSMEVALCLQSVPVVDRQATFINTSRAITMLLILVEVSVKVACRSTTVTDWRHRAISMLLILVEVRLMWLVGPGRHRLKTQIYLHATYPVGSICKCGLSVHNSHTLQPQSHHHATYSDGSICVGGLSVQEDTDFSTELLILVEVSV